MRARTHTNPFNFYHALKPLNFNSIFPTFSGEIDLEIGFGKGVFLRHWAQKYQDRFIVGVDVRKTMVDLLESKTKSFENTYLVCDNAQRIISDCLGDQMINRLFLFHPDPWFKKRHHKRRVIQDDFLFVLKQKMALKGIIYVATDVQLLFDEMKTRFVGAGFEYVEEKSFWDQDYVTHWDSFSTQDKRVTYKAAFQLI